MTLIPCVRPHGRRANRLPETALHASSNMISQSEKGKERVHTKRWSPASRDGAKNGEIQRFYPLASPKFLRKKLSARVGRASHFGYFISRTDTCAIAAGGVYE